MVEIAFYKSSKTILDWGIRFFSKSPYSHCEIVIDRKYSISSSGRDGGIRIKDSINMNFDNTDKWDFYKLDIDMNIDKVREYINNIKSNKDGYDFLSIIFYHALRIPINVKRKYICSEFCLLLIRNFTSTYNRIRLDNYLNLYFGCHEYKVNPSNLLLILEMNNMLIKNNSNQHSTIEK